MRNFISELNGYISTLNSKLMTNIPEEEEASEANPTPTPLTPEELIEKEIKEYINAKIGTSVGYYNSAIAYLGTDSPFYHRTQPRKKTFNEMYIDMEVLVDDLTIYGGNYKENSKTDYSTDIQTNADFYTYEFAEAGLLDVSTYNTSETSFWSGMDATAEKNIIDGLFVPVDNEITTFSSASTANGSNITTIVTENNQYFSRMKSFLALDKTAKWIIAADPLGQPLYDSRTPASKAAIDEILLNESTMTDEDFSAYMKQKREDLKIER